MQKKEFLRSKLHEGHRKRLRERAMRGIADNLQEHEILELLLSFVIARKDTNDLAHRLINTFGSLNNVVEAPYSSLVNFNGLGEVSASFLHFLPEIAKIVYNKKSENLNHINSIKDAVDFVFPMFKNESTEKFVFMLLDEKENLLHYEADILGEKDNISVNIYKLRELCINFKARKVIIVHNHPHGVLTPSKADLYFTKTIFSMLHFQNIVLLDHCIVAPNGECFSFRNSGVVEAYEKDFDKYLNDFIKKSKDSI